MAASVSPTPTGYGLGSSQPQRTSARLALRNSGIRSLQSRPLADTASFRNSYAQPTGDSSDDEDLAPIKLSAEAQAILGEDNSNAGEDKENLIPSADGEDEVKALSGFGPISYSSTRQSPDRENGSPAPRVVRVSGPRPSPRTTLARDGSFQYKIHERAAHSRPEPETKTPAQAMRRVRVSGSRPSPLNGQSSSSDSEGKAISTNPKDQKGLYNETPEVGAARHGVSTATRSRSGEEQRGVQSTMRVRRIGTGALLNGPVRRGIIRRHSEDDEEMETDDRKDTSASPEVQHGRRAREPDLVDLPDDLPRSYGSPDREPRQTYQGKISARQSISSGPRKSLGRSRSPQHDVPAPARSKPTPASATSHPSSQSSGSQRKLVFRLPSLPPLDSAHDQENEPPPTFKREKASAAHLDILEDRNEEIASNGQSGSKLANSHEPHQMRPEPGSPSRPPLQPRSHNTPHRPAPPPPPKMSLVDAATAPSSRSAKKSVHYVLNGRTFRRLDLIGRGGSSRVFRIMAENYKIFALKRVNLEEADLAAIQGYKGEIELLQKLGNCERVVRLFDYEINEEKGVLSVLMELGESDFNKMLNEHLKVESAKLDVNFTRFYWREMLMCVKSVHDMGVVHSDLKPANFLLVKGQLKLIDFGIANSIGDGTVNVHRENQIGTPNYMSPESLVCHQPAAGAAVLGPDGKPVKILKLGKPSDVWSLGCILYQMTYGQPPFAHITKQFERIMSIPNPKVEISFPSTGIGGAVVPFGLIKTLRRCLQRDQSLRPTIEELLMDSDPFLNPVSISPEMLGRVIGNVVGYCRKREEKMKEEGVLGQDGVSCLPKDEEMRGWPAAFYEKLRQAQEEGSAW